MYDRIIAELTATPWMVEPGMGRKIAAILNRRLRGEPADLAGVELAREVAADRAKRRSKPTPRGVAVIPVHGVLTKRADFFTEASGMLSTDQIGQMVDAARDEPVVEAIVLDIDSPGGSVYGLEEAAQKVAAAAKQKKVIAVANSLAASAAYYLMSQASEAVASPSAMVGSIGTVMFHVDESAALAQAGQVVTVIASSELKAAGASPGPLTEAGRAELEMIVSGYTDMFVKAVARGRKVSQSAVRSDFGQGGVLLASDALKVGMVDRVASLDEVLGKYGMSSADLTPLNARKGMAVELRRRKLRME